MIESAIKFAIKIEHRLSKMAAPIVQTLLRCFRQKSRELSPLCWIKPYYVQYRMFNNRELRKFYKRVTLSQSEGWFEINLDQRKLRTPAGNLFKVPHEALAMAVVTEWNAQEKLIKRHNMHLTSLCNTALDNPMRKSRDDLIKGIIHFLETDTVSYRLEEPEDLLRLQESEWDPVVRWIEDRYDIKVPHTTGIASSPDLPRDTRKKLERHLQHHSDWALFGYTFAVDAIKSLVLTLAVIDKHLSVEKAVQLSRLEQDFQTQRWGSVEWYHDIDLHEVQCRLAASALFVHWTSETQTVKQKAMLAHPL